MTINQVGKPTNNSDMLCPDFRKPLRKVCHRCELYQPMHMTPSADHKPGPDSFDHWGCVKVHQAVLLSEIIKRLGGVQTATESFRNTAFKELQQTLADVIDVAKHNGTFNAALAERVRRVLEELGNRPQMLPPPGDGARLLNGKANA